MRLYIVKPGGKTQDLNLRQAKRLLRHVTSTPDEIVSDFRRGVRDSFNLGSWGVLKVHPRRTVKGLSRWKRAEAHRKLTSLIELLLEQSRKFGEAGLCAQAEVAKQLAAQLGKLRHRYEKEQRDE